MMEGLGGMGMFGAAQPPPPQYVAGFPQQQQQQYPQMLPGGLDVGQHGFPGMQQARPTAPVPNNPMMFPGMGFTSVGGNVGAAFGGYGGGGGDAFKAPGQPGMFGGGVMGMNFQQDGSAGQAPRPGNLGPPSSGGGHLSGGAPGDRRGKGGELKGGKGGGRPPGMVGEKGGSRDMGGCQGGGKGHGGGKGFGDAKGRPNGMFSAMEGKGPKGGGCKGGKGDRGPKGGRGTGGFGASGRSPGDAGFKGGSKGGGKKGDGPKGGGKSGGKSGGKGGWAWVDDDKAGGFGGKKGGGFGWGGDRKGGWGGFDSGPSFAAVPVNGGEGDDEEFVEWTEYTEGHGPVYEEEALWTHEAEGETDPSDEVHVYGAHGQEVPGAKMEFEDCVEILSEPAVETLRNAGFTAPTSIQAYTWPIARAGFDVIGVAKTGSGKTLAFLLPGLIKLQEREGTPTAPGVLVLAPTRELALQIEDQWNKFGAPQGLSAACCYGGAPRGPQLSALRAGASVVVACPGRLNDFIEGGQVQLGSCSYVVLDEADRMLDMGFEPQIRRIIEQVPKQRQTLLFTATWPNQVKSLASEFLDKPVHIQIGKNDTLAVNNDISQHVVMVKDDEDKHTKLCELLGQHVEERVLVFTETKRAAEALAKSLKGPPHNIKAVRIHGDMEQPERKQALDTFKAAKAHVMVATDVAARGLDVKGIAVVVNFDAPWTSKEYVHRIGRTGRAGEKGAAYTLLLPNDGPQAREIMQVMDRGKIEVPPELKQLSTQRGRARPGTKGAWGGGNKGWGAQPTGPDLQRAQINQTPAKGTVLEWRGSFGWIKPQVEVKHKFASKHSGKLYVHKKDLVGASSLQVGQTVTFSIYADAAGIGAEKVSPA